MYPHILLFPIIAGAIAQFIKLFTQKGHKNINYKRILAYSGMPSGHSAMVTALTTIVWLEEGAKSPLFAICVVLSIVVIRDALGIRRYLGQHGHILNILVKDLKEDSLLDESYPHLLEKIGHTPEQVLAGILLGFFVSLLGYSFFI
jgi:hypothetical protein